MRNRFAAVAAVVVFLAMLTLPTALYLTVQRNADGLLDEKREPAAFPDSVSDRLGAKLEAWYNDRAPYRLSLITLQKKVAQAYGTPYRNRVHPFLSAVFTPDWYREWRDARHDNTPFLAPLTENNAIYGKGDWLFYASEKSLGYYTRDNQLSQKRLKAWRKDYLALKSACDARGIQLLIAIIPNKEQVYSEYMPSFYVQDKPLCEEVVADYMRQRGIPYIYLLPDILAAKGEREIYCRQDTHWNGLGGFAAAMALFRELGMPTCTLEDSMISTRQKTGGDLSNFVGFSTTYDYHSVKYKPEVTLQSENQYGRAINFITSDADTDRKLVLVGDSFREGCKNFLAKDFKTTTVLRRETVEYDVAVDAVKGLSEGDTLIILLIERYDEDGHKIARTLAGYLS